jgi:hypothetical protein
MESMGTEQLLKILAEDDKNSYSEETFKIIREVLIGRKANLPPEKEVKCCPNCMRKIEISQEICDCGYNFAEENHEEIKLVKKKRRRNNRLSGVMMIVIGSFFLLRWLPYYEYHKTISWIDGIPPLVILIGFWQLIFGASNKAPTESIFDSILGNKNSKDEGDDLPYLFCPSCGKQIFKEMNYKKCPSCKNVIKIDS